MLGALSLVVSARVSEAVEREGGLAAEDAAIVVLLGVEPLTIKALAEATGVTHSGGVRMVNRLQEAGLVRRAAGADGRTVVASLTDAGEHERDRVLNARADAIEPLLAALDPAEREAFAQALRSVLSEAIQTPVTAVRTCRLCDEDSCVPRGCPVEDRYQHLAGV